MVLSKDRCCFLKYSCFRLKCSIIFLALLNVTGFQSEARHFMLCFFFFCKNSKVVKVHSFPLKKKNLSHSFNQYSREKQT